MSSEIDGLIDELALTDALMKLLNQYGILPYKDWKNFEINHEQPRSDEERDLAFSARAQTASEANSRFRQSAFHGFS